MEWPRLLNLSRLGDKDYVEKAERPIYVQDYDRIAFCAPFRRLAHKTQVHPLNDHDHIHHRLIHSIEVASVGRSLGMSIGHWLEEQDHAETGSKHIISGMVQAACLAHDIGNPPFGHSGEAAIGDWFKEKFDAPTGIFGGMEETKRPEFVAFTKYPVTSYVQTTANSDYCGLKKFGIFESEMGIFESTAEKLGLPKETSANGSWWRRHPLVFLVEAADDICYNILDIEDAYTSGDLSFTTVKEKLSPLAGASNQAREHQTNEECIAEMRARGIGAAIDACVDAFKANYSEIMDGTFSSSLIEVSNKSNEFTEIKELAKSRIFTAVRKTELEVLGRNTIHRVLNGVAPVFDELHDENWNPEKLSNCNSQLVRALRLDLRDVNDSYSALHALSDFVSGMTDRYSVSTAKMISGSG